MKQLPVENLRYLKGHNVMRAFLHAKFGDQLTRGSCASDKLPRTSPSPQPDNSSVEGFEAALTKARAAWRASRGPTRTVICNARIPRRREK